MFLDFQGRLDGISSVSDGIGIQENGHHSVSGSLVYVASVFVDQIKKGGEIGLDCTIDPFQGVFL